MAYGMLAPRARRSLIMPDTSTIERAEWDLRHISHRTFWPD
jgi:hypothetical protein